MKNLMTYLPVLLTKEIRNLFVVASVFLYLILSGCAGPSIGVANDFHALSKKIIHQPKALPEKFSTIKYH